MSSALLQRKAVGAYTPLQRERDILRVRTTQPKNQTRQDQDFETWLQTVRLHPNHGNNPLRRACAQHGNKLHDSPVPW